MAEVVPIPKYRLPPSTRGGEFFPNQVSKEIQEIKAEQDLFKSRLTLDDIDARVREDDMLGLNVEASYLIPYRHVDGSFITEDNSGVIRMYKRKLIFNDEATHEQRKNKYIRPTKAQVGRYNNHPFIPKGYPESWDMQEGETTLLICEGEKKAQCAIKYLGVPTLAIAGKDCWSERIEEHDEKTKRRDVEAVLLSQCLRSDHIVIAPDGDITKMHISKSFMEFFTCLSAHHKSVRILHPATKLDDMIADWLEDSKGDVSFVREQFMLIPEYTGGFYSAGTLNSAYGVLCRQNNDGVLTEVHNTLSNARILLKNLPAFGEVWYNLDNNEVYMDDGPLREKVEAVQISDFFQHNCGIVKMSPDTTKRAIGSVAAEDERSPFLDYVKSIEYDGVKRLETMLFELCGGEDTPLNREIGSKWLVASMMRLANPGAIVDYMVISTGAQGLGKSSLPKIIWGLDNVVSVTSDLGGVESARQMHSGVVANFEELSTVHGVGMEKLKAMITNHTDSVRPLYMNTYENKRRRFVMYGSTNRGKFLPDDATGHRRFPVFKMVRTVDFKGLEEAREQLLAEAWHTYSEGSVDGLAERWGNIDLASVVAEDHVMMNPEIEAVREYFEDKAYDGAMMPAADGGYYFTKNTLSAIAGIGEYGRGRQKYPLLNLMEWIDSPDCPIKLVYHAARSHDPITNKRIRRAHWLVD